MSPEHEYDFAAVADQILLTGNEARSTGWQGPCPPRAARRVRPYLGSKPPLDWLIAAAQLPGVAMQVAVALAFERGVTRSQEFIAPRGLFERMRVSKDAEDRALKNLEKAGLITVDRHTGRRPRVALLWARRHGEHEE